MLCNNVDLGWLERSTHPPAEQRSGTTAARGLEPYAGSYVDHGTESLAMSKFLFVVAYVARVQAMMYTHGRVVETRVKHGESLGMDIGRPESGSDNGKPSFQGMTYFAQRTLIRLYRREWVPDLCKVCNLTRSYLPCSAAEAGAHETLSQIDFGTGQLLRAI
jgi:hypothetical protein